MSISRAKQEAMVINKTELHSNVQTQTITAENELISMASANRTHIAIGKVAAINLPKQSFTKTRWQLVCSKTNCVSDITREENTPMS